MENPTQHEVLLYNRDRVKPATRSKQMFYNPALQHHYHRIKFGLLFVITSVVIGLIIWLVLSSRSNATYDDKSLSITSSLCGTWEVISGLPLQDQSDLEGVILYDAAVVGNDDIWLVGKRRNAILQTEDLVVLHWNGRNVQSVKSPLVNVEEVTAGGVIALSFDNIWVVGTSKRNGSARQAFSYQWTVNGWWDTSTVDWRSLPGYLPGFDVELNDIAASSPQDIWAVGSYNNRSHTLTLRWNGSEWLAVSTPNIGPTTNILNKVKSSATNNLWAIGANHYTASDGRFLRKPIVLRWDGFSWSAESIPEEFLEITDLSIAPWGDIWIIGKSKETPTTAFRRPNGNGWNLVPISPLGGDAFLESVLVQPKGDLFAVGDILNEQLPDLSTFEGTHSLALYFDGITWQRLRVPNPSQRQRFTQIVPVSPDELWVAGASYDAEDGPGRAMIARFQRCKQ